LTKKSGAEKKPQLFLRTTDYKGAMAPIRILSALADLLWVPRCAACDNFVTLAGGDSVFAAFCPVCIESLVPTGSPRCPKCGLAFNGVGKDHLCGHCLADRPAFSSSYAPFLYGGALKQAILRFKYRPAPWLSTQLGRLLFHRDGVPVTPDVVIPVPSHPSRLRQRGFNQSALLARHAAAVYRVPLDTTTLRRTREAMPQAGLNRAQRLKRLRGAFTIASTTRLANKRVLLVDDVVTTTATVRAAARALVLAGARRVDVLSLARAP
jgi:ComF family protein